MGGDLPAAVFEGFVTNSASKSINGGSSSRRFCCLLTTGDFLPEGFAIDSLMTLLNPLCFPLMVSFSNPFCADVRDDVGVVCVRLEVRSAGLWSHAKTAALDAAPTFCPSDILPGFAVRSVLTIGRCCCWGDDPCCCSNSRSLSRSRSRCCCC